MRLFALSSLMSSPGKKLSVLVLSHFLSSLFDDAAQSLTSSLNQFIKSYTYLLLKFFQD